MSEHVALFVDRLVSSTTANGDTPVSMEIGRASFSAKKAPSSNVNRLSQLKSSSSLAVKEDSEACESDPEISISHWNCDISDGCDASKPLLAAAAGAAECRICQEEDEVANLESPCACTGSLKFAHQKCVQHWCNEKGDTMCEICRKPYEGSYTAPPSSARADSFPMNIGGSWEIASGERLDLHEPRLFAVASEHHFVESNYEEYTRANTNPAASACFRSVALILTVLLLVRHVLSMTSTVAEEDASSFIMLFLLRAAGFFLAMLHYDPCIECFAMQTSKAGSCTGCSRGCIPIADRASSRSTYCCFSRTVSLKIVIVLSQPESLVYPIPCPCLASLTKLKRTGGGDNLLTPWGSLALALSAFYSSIWKLRCK